MTIETDLMAFETGAPSRNREECAPRTGAPRSAAPPVSVALPALDPPSEKTPAQFGSLYAALECRLAGGDGTLLGEDLLGEGRPVVLGVSSAAAGEGKTTVALHLAMAAARDTFKRVCLIDLSLGQGELGARLGARVGADGVVPVLEGAEHAVPTLQMTGYENLVIIPAGRPPGNPAKLARSPRVEHLLLSARQSFDVVVLDLPSVSSDHVLPLARHVDGLVIVVRAGVTPQDVVRRALDTLGRDRVIGVTLNGVRYSAPSWLQRRLLRA